MAKRKTPWFYMPSPGTNIPASNGTNPTQMQQWLFDFGGLQNTYNKQQKLNAPTGSSTPTVPTIPGFTPPAATPGMDTSPEGLYRMALNSPWYQQALAASNAAGVADTENRRAGIRGMFAQFGLVPTGFNDRYGDVDATTRSLADENTRTGLSTVARMKEALGEELRTSSRRLAARGLRRSGTRGYNMRKAQLGYDRNYSDAVNKLLASAASAYGSYAQGEYNRQMGLSAALQNAIGLMSQYYQSPYAQQPLSYNYNWDQSYLGSNPGARQMPNGTIFEGALPQPGRTYTGVL